ncbi:cytochrome P450 [Nocardia asiatica]|uniref:cytochrome P450 n=1 Tax=Nocardia asiatica TaxID=209252 RepID=UPI0002E765A1|nr:cytochrome P450 [Nocardia asiatica]
MMNPTTAQHPATQNVQCPIRHGSPVGAVDEQRIALYSSHFAADPYKAYEDMRARYGPLVPIELAPGVPATLVISYTTALRIFNDPAHFPADPRTWESTIPPDSPVRPMLGWRRAARFYDGPAHQRLRSVSVDSLGGVDLHRLQDTVAAIAVSLINSLCGDGRADLASQYAFPLVFEALNQIIGCPADIGQQVAEGTAMRFNAGADAAAGTARIAAALRQLSELKLAQPGDDIASRLAHHRENLDEAEMLGQLMSFYGAGIEPTRNLILNTLLLMFTNERFGGDILGGSLATRDALDKVLFDNPPMANFCVTYPSRAILVDNTWLPAHQPVVISLAACNTDPAILSDDRVGNRSHLAFGVGPHACPADRVAYLIAQVGIDQLLDALPDMRLAVPVDALEWRPGPFHRALKKLPVTFAPSAPLNIDGHTESP